jgi:hypothetical protein
VPILLHCVKQMSFTSFLVDGDDEQLTLEAALALIEHCDAGGEVELSNRSNGSERIGPTPTRSVALDGNTDSAGSRGSNTSDQTASTKLPRASRGKRKPGASTEQQRRQRRRFSCFESR